MPKIPSKLGPVYSKDGIVLYLGDSREILPTLPAGSIQFIFTDPPYGHNNNNGDLIHRREAALGQGPHGKSRAIANDGIEANELVQWAFKEFNRLLQPGCCCCCCCGGGGPDPQFARWSLWLDEAVGFKQMVVWDKGPMGMGWHYRRSYETVLVGEKPGAACHWYDETKRIENIIRPGWFKKIIPGKEDHPTEKPLGLVEHFLRLHTRSGDTVLDPFLGYGTTALACSRWNRKMIGIELDRKSLEVCIERLENFAGGGIRMDARKQLKLSGRRRP